MGYWKEWRERYVVLTKTHLLSFKERVTNGRYENPTEVIPMKSCQTVKSSDDETNKPDTFKLEVSGTVFYFMAPSFAEKEAWIGALGRCMIKPTVLIDDNF